jgi:methylated-DNA-[protein]-cysteine S-methyltransferase
MLTGYYSYYESPIGLIKIGGTEVYINEISFIDDTTLLQNRTSKTNEVINKCTEELIEYFRGKRRSFTVPVHQEGTDFQKKVWGKLMDIKYGTTISYKDLAINMGDERVIRAAAATNGKNKISIIIPCHRVIGTSKNLVGYSGGLMRKKWLLQMEFREYYGIKTLF